ncbi:glycosyltransferase family 4 protein [Gammaproteobacteria bacterium]|nr:glycosyltransferase family 4 protein [Gammaproteobacteria bacterium]
MKKLRILLPFVGDTIGGSHISTIILARVLRQHNHDVIIGLHRVGPLADYLTDRGIAYHHLQIDHFVAGTPRTIKDSRHAIKCFRAVRRSLEKLTPDIVHTNDGRCHLSWIPVARLAGIPTIWHQRTLLDASRLTRNAIRLATRTVSISEFVKASLPGRLSQDSIVVPNPVEQLCPSPEQIARCRARICAEGDIGAEAAVVGFFGNLRNIKAPLVAVEAFIRMQASLDKELLMIVVGDDREGFRERMERIAASANTQAKILFFGFQSEVLPWIASCDLVLATSEGDAFGRTIIEAMSLGVPVVATDAGGHSEVLTHRETGMLAPVNRPQDIAAAAVEVMTDGRLRRILVAQGKASAKGNYSGEYHARKILKLYASLHS